MSRIRPYQEATGDFDRLLAFIAGQAAPNRAMTPAGLRSFLTEPGYHAETDLFLAPAADGADLLAARDIRISARGDEEILIFESWGAARPEALPERLAAALLGAAEQRAADILARQRRSAGILQARCDQDDVATAALFEAAGLDFARPLVSMLRGSVGDVAEPRLPEGITLRSYQVGGDDRAWVDAFNDAFADHWGGFMGMSRERWHHALADQAFNPEISLVAVHGTEIAGFCHGRIDAELNALNHRRLGMIRYVGVRPRWRGLGLGSALARAGMIALRDAGMTAIALVVDADNVTGAHRLYERLGFAIVHRQAMYRKRIGLAGANGQS